MYQLFSVSRKRKRSFQLLLEAEGGDVRLQKSRIDDVTYQNSPDDVTEESYDVTSNVIVPVHFEGEVANSEVEKRKEADCTQVTFLPSTVTLCTVGI